MKGIR